MVGPALTGLTRVAPRGWEQGAALLDPPWGTLAPVSELAALARALPDARLIRLPGSHFLPLQMPAALVAELGALRARAGFPPL